MNTNIEQTTKAEEQRIPTSEGLTHRHAVGTACDRHTTPPAGTPTRHSQPLGVCSRRGVEANGNGADVQGLRRVGPSDDLPPSPLSPTPHEGNQRDLEATESMWSRISSVSRRSFTRIYEFLTGSRDRETTSTNHIYQDPLDKFGSTTEATSQGSLDPNRRHFSPPPPPGGGECAGPPP